MAPSAQTCPHTPSRVASAVLLVALLTAACTASTTIEAGDSIPAATTAETSVPLPTDIPGDEPAPTIAPSPSETPAESDSNDTSPDEPTAVPTEPVPQNTPPVGTTQVVLLDAGAEPRVELRLEIAASCGEIMTVDQTQETVQTLDDLPLPGGGVVGSIVEMATSATRNGDDYDVRSEIVAAYASTATDASVAATMNVELARLVGITTFVTMTPRGVQVPDTYRVEGAEALGPLQSAVESIGQVQAPLPIEPVGIGARWETTSVVDFEGAALITISEYLVTNLDGTLVDIQVSASQSVATGTELNLQGSSVEVTEWTGSTTGQTTLDMATISPIRSVATTEATQGLDFGAQGGLLHQKLTSDMLVTSEPDDGCTGRTIRP